MESKVLSNSNKKFQWLIQSTTETFYQNWMEADRELLFVLYLSMKNKCHHDEGLKILRDDILGIDDKKNSHLVNNVKWNNVVSF